MNPRFEFAKRFRSRFRSFQVLFSFFFAINFRSSVIFLRLVIRLRADRCSTPGPSEANPPRDLHNNGPFVRWLKQSIRKRRKGILCNRFHNPRIVNLGTVRDGKRIGPRKTLEFFSFPLVSFSPFSSTSKSNRKKICISSRRRWRAFTDGRSLDKKIFPRALVQMTLTFLFMLNTRFYSLVFRDRFFLCDRKKKKKSGLIYLFVTRNRRRAENG